MRGGQSAAGRVPVARVGPPDATRATPRSFPPPASLPEQYRGADRGGMYGIACDIEEGLAQCERHSHGALESLRIAALQHATRGDCADAAIAVRAASARAAASFSCDIAGQSLTHSNATPLFGREAHVLVCDARVSDNQWGGGGCEQC